MGYNGLLFLNRSRVSRGRFFSYQKIDLYQISYKIKLTQNVLKIITNCDDSIYIVDVFLKTWYDLIGWLIYYCMQTLFLDESHHDQRFDRLLRKIYKKYREISLSFIFMQIRTWQVLLNGKRGKPETRVKKWDVILFVDEQPVDTSLGVAHLKPKLRRQDLKQHILYEDECRIIRNKPVGIVMHEWNDHYKDISMNDILEQYLWRNEHETFKPSFCYRLDRDTSGVVVSAKTYEALKYLNALIQNRWDIKKIYKARCVWKPDNQTIDAPLFKWYNATYERAQTFVNFDKWLEATTIITQVRSITHPELKHISCLDIQIKTWRMHQIRVHLGYIWHPVIGDMMYGDASINAIAGRMGIHHQLLHAYEYSFCDHRGIQIWAIAPLTSEFKNIW